MEAWKYPLLFAVGAVVSFINSISGGGSILSLPLLIFFGLPSAVANGTNRLGILVGSLGSIQAFRSQGRFLGRLVWRVAWPGALGSLAGSMIAVRLPDRIFQPILAGIILFVAAMSIPRRNPAKAPAEGLPRMRAGWLASSAYAAIGFYGGFIQAGSGLIMIYAFRRLGNLDVFQINSLKSANTLVFITVSLITFAWHGKIDWGLAAALAAGNWLGGWFGSHWQVRQGETWVYRFVFASGLAMAAKLLWDTWKLWHPGLQ